MINSTLRTTCSFPLRRLLPLTLAAAWALSAGCVRQPPSKPVTTPLQTSLANTLRHPNDLAAHLDLAEQYVGSGETFAACEQWEIARKLGADDEKLLLRLAESYESLGEVEDAANVLTEAAAKPKASASLHLAAGRMLFKLGDFRGAAEAVRPLTRQWESLPDADRQYVTRVFLLAGDTEQAGKLLPKTSSDPEWEALRGLEARLRGNARAAAQAFAEAVARSPQDGWNLYVLGQARLAAGDKSGALDAWKRAGQLPDAPARARIAAARLLLQAGNTREAESFLNRVQAEDQKDPVYWQTQSLLAQKRGKRVADGIARGYAAYYGGDPRQAEAIWQATLPQAKSEDARELYAGIINSAYQREDAPTALRFSAEAVNQWPRDPYFLKKRAEILLRQNLLSDSLAVAQRLKQAAPPEQEADVCELLERIALDSGNAALLNENAQRQRALQPSNPDPLLHLAEWQAAKGGTPENLERTLKLYQEAMAIAPQNAEAQARAGILLTDLKRPQEAAPLLLHALTLDPRVLEGVPDSQLAQIDQRQGATLEAAFHTARYLRLRKLKDAWPTQLKLLRQDRPAPEWKALGETALARHETWIALCAFTRAVRLAPKDAEAWRLLAEAQKRSGRFDEALEAMRTAHLSAASRTPVTEARGDVNTAKR